MRRREFLAAACAAFASLAAYAQQKTARVGLLALTNPEPHWTLLTDAFREIGYVAGKNVEFERRLADGSPEVLARHASDLVRVKSDIIIAILTPSVQAAMKATSQIPIVMIAGAPLETGLVTSLSRPGGNVTGVSTTGTEVAAKTLEVLRETVPSLRTVAVLVNGEDLGFGKPLLAQMEAAGRSLSLTVRPYIVRGTDELDAAFAAIGKGAAQVAIAQGSLPRARAIDLAIKHRIPLGSSQSAWADAGALMVYAPDLRDVCRRAVAYADRLLKGARPGDLPIEQPTQFQLILNRKTARAIGLNISPSVLLRADRVVE
jgi:putative ABC transport system substrate-binding protein